MRGKIFKTSILALLVFQFSGFSFICFGQTIEPYKAQTIEPYQGKSIEPEKKKSNDGETIKPYNGNTISPDKPVRRQRRIIRPQNGGNSSSNAEQVTNPEQPQKQEPVVKPSEVHVNNTETVKEKTPDANIDLSSYFGLYQYWVPGVAYTFADYSNNTLVLHNSSGTGVLPGGIVINPDGTYIWNSSWDEKIIKGKWSSSGNTEYPITLLGAQEGRSWRVGRSSDPKADITIWDGNTWYNGKKVKK